MHRSALLIAAIGLWALALGCSTTPSDLPTGETGSPDPGPGREGSGAGSPTALIEMFSLDHLARWLVVYDRLAWVSSDLVREATEAHPRLGREWFCYEDASEGWHAVYGKYDPVGDTYDAVLHYDVDDEMSAHESTAPVPMELALPIARAIFASFPLLEEELGDLRIRMNTYVRAVEEGIEVWFLPAMLDDGRCVNGGEFCFRFDREGRRLLRRDVLVTEFRAFAPAEGSEIVLEDPGRTIPSLGNLFFALHHHGRFAEIRIETADHVALLVESEGRLDWILVARDTE